MLSNQASIAIMFKVKAKSEELWKWWWYISEAKMAKPPLVNYTTRNKTLKIKMVCGRIVSRGASTNSYTHFTVDIKYVWWRMENEDAEANVSGAHTWTNQRKTYIKRGLTHTHRDLFSGFGFDLRCTHCICIFYLLFPYYALCVLCLCLFNLEALCVYRSGFRLSLLPHLSNELKTRFSGYDGSLCIRKHAINKSLFLGEQKFGALYFSPPAHGRYMWFYRYVPLTGIVDWIQWNEC